MIFQHLLLLGLLMRPPCATASDKPHGSGGGEVRQKVSFLAHFAKHLGF